MTIVIASVIIHNCNKCHIPAHHIYVAFVMQLMRAVSFLCFTGVRSGGYVYGVRGIYKIITCAGTVAMTEVAGVTSVETGGDLHQAALDISVVVVVVVEVVAVVVVVLVGVVAVVAVVVAC